ncbi:hypothetical protein GH733_015121, partial [Mirounga leonina]
MSNLSNKNMMKFKRFPKWLAAYINRPKWGLGQGREKELACVGHLPEQLPHENPTDFINSWAESPSSKYNSGRFPLRFLRTVRQWPKLSRNLRLNVALTFQRMRNTGELVAYLVMIRAFLCSPRTFGKENTSHWTTGWTWCLYTWLSGTPLDCVGPGGWEWSQNSSEGSFLAAPGLVVEKVPGSLGASGEDTVRKTQQESARHSTAGPWAPHLAFLRPAKGPRRPHTGKHVVNRPTQSPPPLEQHPPPIHRDHVAQLLPGGSAGTASQRQDTWQAFPFRCLEAGQELLVHPKPR